MKCTYDVMQGRAYITTTAGVHLNNTCPCDVTKFLKAIVYLIVRHKTIFNLYVSKWYTKGDKKYREITPLNFNNKNSPKMYIYETYSQ